MSTASDIFHYDGLTYWGPYGVDRMERIYDRARLSPGARVLDVGCGAGELLLRWCERVQAHAVGIDRSTSALQRLRTSAAERVPGATIELIENSVTESLLSGLGTFAWVSWVGGPYVGEDFSSTIRALTERVVSGGYLLVGQGYWSAPPPQEFLDETGLQREEFTSYHEQLSTLEAMGLRTLYSQHSSRDEWDHFEGVLLSNVEHYAHTHADAPDPQGRLEQRRVFHRAQQRWGRSVFGFALTLFLRR